MDVVEWDDWCFYLVLVVDSVEMGRSALRCKTAVRFFDALLTEIGIIFRLFGRVIATSATGAAYASSASAAPGPEGTAVAAAGDSD